MEYVDLATYGFVLEPKYYIYGWSKDSRILGRESAVSKLQEAQSLLPTGLRFKIWDMQRPLYVQVNMIEAFRRQLAFQHPDLGPEQIEHLVDRYTAKPLPDSEVVRRDCHRNGGAVDLTIIREDGTELDMGTPFDDPSPRSALKHYHKIEQPSPWQSTIVQNREILIQAMEGAGWENYSPEWWHWSIED